MKLSVVKFLLISLSLTSLSIAAQEYNPLLKKYSDSLRYHSSGVVRARYDDSFTQLLKESLQDETAFSLNLDSIMQTVSILTSEDGKIKVISWVYINDREEYTNHCVVLYRKKLKSEAGIFWLKDFIDNKADSVYTDFPADFWPGALYYQMYHFKKKGKDYYCVLGLNGQSSYSNRKVIDVLWVDKDGELHIGAPVFYLSDRDYTPAYRVFFIYADQSTMLLRFEKDEKMITYSNLVPNNPEHTGSRQYYIPDGRIDYYKLTRKGKWIRHEGLADFNMQGNE